MPLLDDDSLLAAVADDHRRWFARCAEFAGGEVVDAGGTELYAGPETMAFPRSTLDVEAFVAAIGERGIEAVGVWSLAEDFATGTRLLARGFGWGWQPHWMAADLAVEPQPPPVEPPIGPATPPFANTLPYRPTAPLPPEAVHLGMRLREKLIGQVVVHPGPEVAGIYSMGVVPKVRGRGFGTALARAALHAAWERGARHAVLNATVQGIPVYRRAGFRSLGWGQTWWYRGDRPPPSPRQAALVEALGFGDLEALEALAPSAEELTTPLPAGDAPLEVPTLAGQAEALAYAERASRTTSGPGNSPGLGDS